MQSIRLFLAEKNSPYGIRTSMENFGELPDLEIVPLYALGNHISHASSAFYPRKM